MATETLNFKVKGMSCGHCARRVENAALGVEGVSSAKVDLGSEQLRIECAGEPLVQALADAIREAGYEMAQG
ncbi:MAG: heavy-metal-associated domain-containing protein [Planctomycetota bacterium]|nr:heavy-metal-associated domain-containing protein [Planctomycetota bacterium]